MAPRRLILFLAMTFIAAGSYCQSAERSIQSAYKNKSLPQLRRFFENWNKTVPPLSPRELSNLNDTIKGVYNVFAAFYQPMNIKNLGGSEWGNDIYKKTGFLIIQNSVKVYLTDNVYHSDKEIDSLVVSIIENTHNFNDSVKKQLLIRKNGKLRPSVIERFNPFERHFYERKDSLVSAIENFRPPVHIGDKKAIYLVPKYDTLLNAFLGDAHLPLGSGGIMKPASSLGESKKRQKFLENFIKIWYGHWGGYWQLCSYPKAEKIICDKKMKYALVEFSMVYEGGEALLKNDNGKWTLISSKLTWIE